MSREYVYLSFFKENKIDYIYHSEMNNIVFPCLYCEHTAKMCSITSEWSCSNCRNYGTLIHLIDFARVNSFRGMYIPGKEKKSLAQMLHRLSKKYPEDQSITIVREKVRRLINYYEKTPQSNRT